MLYLEIECCESLANADTIGLSDPFVVLKINGLEVDRTSVIDDCCDPVWYDECYALPVNFRDWGKDDLMDVDIDLEVWDNNTYSVGMFLGVAHFKGRDFLHDKPHPESILRQLVDFPKGSQPVPPAFTKRDDLLDDLLLWTKYRDDMKDKEERHYDIENRGLEIEYFDDDKPEGRNITSAAAAAAPTTTSRRMSFARSSTVAVTAESEQQEPPAAAVRSKAGKALRLMSGPGSLRTSVHDPTRRDGGSGITTGHDALNKVSANRKVKIALLIIALYFITGVVGFSFVFERWRILDSLYYSKPNPTTHHPHPEPLI